MKFNRFVVRLGLAFSLTAAFVAGCKKTNDPQPLVSGTVDVRDSVYYIAKELFLWTDKLPTLADFKPTSYDSPEALMAKVRTYSPANSAGNGNVDRWSFATPVAEWNKVLTGSNAGFGFSRSYASENDLRVAYTYPNSPIGQAGVERGWRITKLNGAVPNSTNDKPFADALASNTGTFEFVTNTGETKTITLTKAEYKSNAVLKKSVLDVGGKKVGYLLYNSFILSTSQQELDEAFAYFKQAGVTELVADLRYNSGGYVNIAERFANYVVPLAAAGKLMYTDQHNEKYKGWNRTKNFDGTLPANALKLSRIAFITTRSSASATELLINVLRPYMDVKLFGNDTYGKPVGYYQIPVMGYISSPVAVIQTNAANYGGYYDGLPADRKQTDDYTHNFGDPAESSLKDALTYLQTGSVPARQAARVAAGYQENPSVESESFVGAIQETPKALLR
ncbi:MAG: hypothetical protein H7Y12_15745 [Sphingobacteriaceae bacterium]|nr:hypothetical protein [Cytophagaceae bacterium]